MGLGGLLLGAATIGLRAVAQPQEQVIKILARRFTYTPNKLTLKKGVPVVLELTTADVLMGFSVPDFNTRADIVPGQVAKVRLVPDKVGTFEFLCDIFCGSGHETMNGTITVVA
jgi:cytochrome c oxidase subunit II